MNKTLKIFGGGYKRYDEITFLRGLSILTIVLMHYLQSPALPGILNKVLSVGGTGVHVFSFCSGFGLYQSYLEKPVGYSEFVKSRFFKVYIPYILVVAISALFPFTYEGDHLKAFLSHLLLYKMFVPKYESSFGYQLWYVSTLYQFYFVFIPLAKIKEKVDNTKLFLTVCCFVSGLWWVFSTLAGIADERVWGSFFLQYLWEFALGMFIAEYMWNGGMLKIKGVTLLFVGMGGLAIAGFLKIIGGFLTTFNDPFAFTGYVALALLLYTVGPTFIKRYIEYISGISYELYLVHILMITLLRQFIANNVVMIVTGLALSLIMAKVLKKAIAIDLIHQK